MSARKKNQGNSSQNLEDIFLIIIIATYILSNNKYYHLDSSNLHNITRALSEKGLKVTHQRIVVLEALMETNRHPAAEDIYEKINKKYPSISLATVYKTLETFVENDLIDLVSSPHGKMRYDARTDNHNHIYVSNTNEILDYEDEELRNILMDYLKRKKFENLNITDIKLHIRGEKIDLRKGITIL